MTMQMHPFQSLSYLSVRFKEFGKMGKAANKMRREKDVHLDLHGTVCR